MIGPAKTKSAMELKLTLAMSSITMMNHTLQLEHMFTATLKATQKERSGLHQLKQQLKAWQSKSHALKQVMSGGSYTGMIMSPLKFADFYLFTTTTESTKQIFKKIY